MIPTLQVDVGARSVDPWLEVMAWVVGILVLSGWAYGIVKFKYRGIDMSRLEHLRVIRGQLISLQPSRVTVPRGGFGSKRVTIAELLQRPQNDQNSHGDVTVREAFRDLRHQLRESSPRVPALAVRGFVEGVLILAVGSVLFISATRWETMLAQATIGDVDAVIDAAATFWEGFVQALALFPAANTLWELLVAGAILLAQQVYQQWLLVGIVLIAGSVALAYVDRATAEDLAVRLYPNRLRSLGALVGAGAAVWLAGAIPATLFRTAGYETVGVAVGATAAGLVASGALVLAGHDIRRRLVDRQQLPDEHTGYVALYLLIRKCMGVAVLAALPLLVVYLGMATVSGAALEVGTVIVAAPLVVQLALLAAVGGVIALVVVQFPDAASEIRHAVGRASRSHIIRSWMFARAAPATAMVLAFTLTWALFGVQPVGGLPLLSALLGLWPPLVAALVVGVVARTATLVWQSKQAELIQRDYDDGRRQVSVDCFPQVRDADDGVVYIARVDGHTLAHRDVRRLLDDIHRVAEWYFDPDQASSVYLGWGDGGGPPVTESRYYYKELDTGRVDLDAVRSALRGDVRTRIQATFRSEDGRVDATQLESELDEDYPERDWRGALQEFRRRADVSKRDGQYIQHGR